MCKVDRPLPPPPWAGYAVASRRAIATSSGNSDLQIATAILRPPFFGWNFKCRERKRREEVFMEE
jgi:hypothetical protein